MTPNELQPQVQTHSKPGAITNMLCLLPTPPRLLEVISQPKAQMLRSPLPLVLGEANWPGGRMQSIAHWYIRLGFSISYTALQSSLNSGSMWAGEDCTIPGSSHLHYPRDFCAPHLPG